MKSKILQFKILNVFPYLQIHPSSAKMYENKIMAVKIMSDRWKISVYVLSQRTWTFVAGTRYRMFIKIIIIFKCWINKAEITMFHILMSSSRHTGGTKTKISILTFLLSPSCVKFCFYLMKAKYFNKYTKLVHIKYIWRINNSVSLYRVHGWDLWIKNRH